VLLAEVSLATRVKKMLRAGRQAQIISMPISATLVVGCKLAMALLMGDGKLAKSLDRKGTYSRKLNRAKDTVSSAKLFG
jgi:hypothetical protein